MGDPGPLVLYVEGSWTSPWVCAVHVVLREKQIPFTTSLAMVRHGVGAIDRMYDRSLTGTAPVLQQGDFWLAESLAIVEYLEELVPQPRMLPADPRDRGRARQLMTWMRADHEPLRAERSAEVIMYPPPPGGHPPLSPRVTRIANDLIRVAQKLGADGRGALFGGFGVVDVDLAFALKRLVATGFEVPEPVRSYVDAVWNRPSVREFADHPRPGSPASAPKPIV